MLNKAKRICKIANRFSEVVNGGQGNITVGFPSLWENVSDSDINFLLEDVNDAEFEKRLEHIYEQSKLM